MLVFMEYCDRGTIDEVSRVGLTEDLIRLYTKQLLKAVQVLHDNKIVHRDIKGKEIVIKFFFIFFKQIIHKLVNFP